MTRKFISLALAVTLIMSLFTAFSFTANAVDDGSIGLRLVSNAVAGMQPGDIVTVQVYYTVPDLLDLSIYRHSLSNIVIAYNSTYFTYRYTTNTYDGRTWGEAYSFNKVAAVVTHTVGFWNNVKGKFTAEDNTKSYGDCIMIQQAYDTTAPEGYSSTTGYPLVPDCPIFTIQFTVASAITPAVASAANIGIPTGSNTTGQTVIRYQNGTTSSIYGSANVDFTEAVDTTYLTTVNLPSETKIRENADNSAQVDLGFTGKFLIAGIPINIVGGRATNVSEVGVQLTINGVTNTYTDNYVYEDGTTGYKFRVALTGIPAANFDTPIKARMYVVYNGTTHYSDYVYTTAGAHVSRLP